MPQTIMNDSTILRNELEHRIIQGLAHQYQNELWLLDSHQRARMKTPLFALKDMSRRLGYWSLEKREICLSRKLIFNYGWDAVCDVLRHEMAHQYATEVLDGREQKAHGPAFQEACRLLRASPEASGTYKPLPERVGDQTLGENDRIILKIKKLMALAESSHPHEAEAAMAKARQLIIKYNLDIFTSRQPRDFFSIFVGKPALRHSRDVYHLAHLLISFYFVRGIWVGAFVVSQGKMGRVLEISGTAQNIKIAAYVHDYVQRYIETQWRGYEANKKLGRGRKIDFAVGIIRGFRTKLESVPKNQSEGSTQALMKLEDPLLKEYMDYRFPRLRSIHHQRLAHDRQVLQDGIDAGLKLVIAEGITSEGGYGGGLLSEK